MSALLISRVKHTPAGFKFLIIWVGLCSFLVLPGLSLFYQNIRTPDAAPAVTEHQVVGNSLGEMEPLFVNIIKPQIHLINNHNGFDNLPVFFKWCFSIWLAGFFTLVFRLGCGLSGMRRLKRKTQNHEWITLDLPYRFPIRIARANLQFPVTCGLLRSLVILPENFHNRPQEQQQAILFHEAAHIKRRDNLLNLLSQIVTAVYWFNPIVWMAQSELRINREEACDDWVLATGVKPSAYAAILFNALRGKTRLTIPERNPFILNFCTKGEKRLKHILNSTVNHHTPGARTKILLILIAVALWVPLSTFQLFAAITGDIDATPGAAFATDGIEVYLDNHDVVKLSFLLKNHQRISLSGPADDFPFGWPESKPQHQINSPFGFRPDPILKQGNFHSGIDIRCPLRTPIHATADGKVLATEFKGGYGKMVIIAHSNFTTLYAKLAEFTVKPGDLVKKGDLIAYSGNTGRSTGPHLHYEIHYNAEPIDPEGFCRLGIEPAAGK